MRMFEARINQPKITPKRIKVEEIVEEEEDRISALPDLLLLEILSRLPYTEEAIRTGTLSKRWKYLWISVPTLIFGHIYADKRPLSGFYSFVDKTLFQTRRPKLRKFAVETKYYIQFESQVNNWIRYAISCNVEEVDLKFFNWDPKARFLLNEYFFVNSCFTDLKLSFPRFNPNGGAVGWKRLRSLYIGHCHLEKDLIENILSGTPLLETLELEYCYGYRRLDITSKSVKKLVLSSYLNPFDRTKIADIIEINAPNILSLTIQGDLLLWKILLLNVSSLVEAKLDFSKAGRHDETTEEEADEEMLKGFIRSLCHVKELKIGNRCSKDAYKQVMLEKNDPDTIVHPHDDTELLEVQQLKEKIQKMEQEQAERKAQNTQRDARIKEMENKLKAFEELLLSRFPRPPPS